MSGIPKKLDLLGRITIPIEMRRDLNLVDGESILYVDYKDGYVVVKPETDNNNSLTKEDIEIRLSNKYSDEQITQIIKDLNLE